MAAIIRYEEARSGIRLGLVQAGLVYDITQAAGTLTGWLQSTSGDVAGAILQLQDAAGSQPAVTSLEGLLSAEKPDRFRLLAPVESQEVWAAGVTYDRSRSARQEEAQDGGDIYARVYAAQRPELFFKSPGYKVVAPGQAVGIRSDARLSVPEPELAVLVNPALEVVGFSAGNDMSSRDIEGANPLYLPQAKIYTASCALGPVIELASQPVWPQKAIRMQIVRQEQVVFSGETHTRSIHRTLADLLEYLGRSSQFPEGALLLTGTGIVPPIEFSLQAGDLVQIEIDGIGTLSNPVRLV